MISLMETQKLSHCIGRTVVRLLRGEPRNHVEYSHRGSRSVIYGTIIAFELQQLIWIKVLWGLRGEVGGQSPIYSLLFKFPAVSNQTPRQRSFYVTQP